MPCASQTQSWRLSWSSYQHEALDVVRADLIDVGDHGPVHHGSDASPLDGQSGENQSLYHLQETKRNEV